MATVKLMIYPEWMVDAMKQNGLTFEAGTDLKMLEGIVSVRDLVIYSALNSLHLHQVLETALIPFNGVLPGLDIDAVTSVFMSGEHDNGVELSYRELSNQIYDPEALGSDAVSILCNDDADRIRLVPETIIGDTIHARIVPTTMSRRDAVKSTLTALAQLINDESPIVMEDTALFELYCKAVSEYSV